MKSKMNKKIFYIGIGILIIHTIILFGVLSSMVIMWKIFQPSTYFLWERVALILSLPVSIIIGMWEAMDI